MEAPIPKGRPVDQEYCDLDMCLTFRSLVSRSVPLLKHHFLTLIQLCAYQTFGQWYLVGFCKCKFTSPLIEWVSVLDLRKKLRFCEQLVGELNGKVLPEPSEWRQAYTSTFILPSLNIDPVPRDPEVSFVRLLLCNCLSMHPHHPQMYQNLNVNCMSSGPRHLEFRQVRRKASSHCQSLMIFLH